MDGGGYLLQPVDLVILPPRPSRGSCPLVSILMPKWRAVEIMVAGPPCSIEEVLYYPECAGLDLVQQRQALRWAARLFWDEFDYAAELFGSRAYNYYICFRRVPPLWWLQGELEIYFKRLTRERNGYPHIFDDVRPGLIVLVVAVMVYDKL